MKLVIVSNPSDSSVRGTEGVDMLTNPLALGQARFASAVNMQFTNGEIKSRPGFRYNCLGVSGVFQGATYYSPSKGMSSRVFASEETGLVVAVNGRIYVSSSEEGQLSCPAFPICGSYDFPCHENVNLFAAEDWLIGQSLAADTIFWNGKECASRSPGMKEPDRSRPLNAPKLEPPGCSNGCKLPCNCDRPIMADNKDTTPLPEEDSHDSFMTERHEQWLVNGAGLGVYAHGRVHQETPFAIFVGDIVHKRGFTSTDDLLLMEEQALESFGDPLVWASSMGKMQAFRLLPQGRTPNGQGPLVGYFSNGIMTFNTFQFPRESRMVDGRQATKGWGDIQMSEQQTAIVSAVGRYAVTDLTSDHVFRSPYGIHYLKNVLGEKSEKTEQIDVTSHFVKPLLTNREEQSYLEGTTVGFWPTESRVFCSVGMVLDSKATSSSMGRGFVSYNQAARFTEDRTPIPTWEGLWLPHHKVKGIHYFTHVEDSPSITSFGFLCSDTNNGLQFGFIDAELQEDLFGGESVPIEWSFETSQFVAQGYDKLKSLKDGRLEIYVNEKSRAVRVMARSNVNLAWELWKEVDLSDIEAYSHKPITLGKHPTLGEATWFQVRVEGLGYCEIDYLAVDHSGSKTKAGDSPCQMVRTSTESIYETALTPPSDRWPTQM
jgi:hypothetical protein